MKKNFVKALFSLAVLVLFSGCAIHGGIMSDSVALSENNFKMMRYVEGSSKTTKVFGIGGLAKNALVAEAKKNLMQNYPLQEGQALANVTVDFKTSIVFFVVTTRATVTADVVEFQ